jgi:hypothetical protein
LLSPWWRDGDLDPNGEASLGVADRLLVWFSSSHTLIIDRVHRCSEFAFPQLATGDRDVAVIGQLPATDLPLQTSGSRPRLRHLDAARSTARQVAQDAPRKPRPSKWSSAIAALAVIIRSAVNRWRTCRENDRGENGRLSAGFSGTAPVFDRIRLCFAGYTCVFLPPKTYAEH